MENNMKNKKFLATMLGLLLLSGPIMSAMEHDGMWEESYETIEQIENYREKLNGKFVSDGIPEHNKILSLLKILWDGSDSYTLDFNENGVFVKKNVLNEQKNVLDEQKETVLRIVEMFVLKRMKLIGILSNCLSKCNQEIFKRFSEEILKKQKAKFLIFLKEDVSCNKLVICFKSSVFKIDRELVEKDLKLHHNSGEELWHLRLGGSDYDEDGNELDDTNLLIVNIPKFKS